MSKLILKILISLAIVFVVFFVYLGTTDFVVVPKILEREYQIEKN